MRGIGEARSVVTITPPRRAALAMIREVDRGRRLDLVWESTAPSLSPTDRPWVQDLVFGHYRLRGRVDHLLGLHLHHGLDSLALPLLQVLRMGAYQLLEMGSVPAYAAVSQSVAQARDAGGEKGAGLVNAVLRALGDVGGGTERFPDFERDPVAYLSSWGSHPAWLMQRWVGRFGATAARRMVEAGNRVPDLYLRPMGRSLEDGASSLGRAGISSEEVPGTATLKLPPGTDPVAALGATPGIIQDPAASSVVDWIHAREGQEMLDLCAAPGGKAIAFMGLGVRVTAADASRPRLLRMRKALLRLGLPARLVVGRAEDPPFVPADVVLVDAPCTGTATLARHPDARWRMGPGDPSRMAGVQRDILVGAARVVRPGGVLVYATCTLEIDENESAVEEFLARHTDFSMDGETAILRVFPGEISTDGSFAARLRRVK